MPTIYIRKKKCSIEDKYIPILNIYEKMLSQYILPLAVPGQKTELEMKEKEKENWINKIKLLIEKVTPFNMNAHEKVLEDFRVEVDSDAKILYDAYEQYLMSLLLNLGKTQKNILLENIPSRFILIVEILLRTAAIALSSDMEGVHDGNANIELLTLFAEEVGNAAKLYTNSLEEKFYEELNGDNLKFIYVIAKRVDVIKCLNLPKETFNILLDHFIHINKIIKCQIIACLDPNFELQEIDDWFYKITLDKLIINLEKRKKSGCSSQDSYASSLVAVNKIEDVKRREFAIKLVALLEEVQTTEKIFQKNCFNNQYI